MLPVTLPIPLTVALPSLSIACATHEYWPASEVFSVLNDTLTVEEEPADRLVNRMLFPTVCVKSSSVTLRLVTLTLTVTVQLMEKSTDPSTLLPEVEKLTKRAVERVHTYVWIPSVSIECSGVTAALTWRG